MSTSTSSLLPGAPPESSVRSVRRLCVVAIVAGVILFAAGWVTWSVEFDLADQPGNSGRVMPAEVATLVLGPVLTTMAAMLLSGMGRAPADQVVRSVRRLCVVAMVAGVVLFAAGWVTWSVEFDLADQPGNSGRVMPAEVATLVLGPVLTTMAIVLLSRVRGSRP
ncbi:hypothetical protein [Salana multivorans]|uniref:hypothetical protein n=1 Tax=Salana multivorans TaxID=120377 RepID=UPI00249009EC|nr:hypothetical protein [Salana multivorans]